MNERQSHDAFFAAIRFPYSLSSNPTQIDSEMDDIPECNTELKESLIGKGTDDDVHLHRLESRGLELLEV